LNDAGTVSEEEYPHAARFFVSRIRSSLNVHTAFNMMKALAFTALRLTIWSIMICRLHFPLFKCSWTNTYCWWTKHHLATLVGIHSSIPWLCTRK